MADERRVHDRALLDALEAIGAAPFEREVWRIARKGQEPLRGSTANGRWSPAGEFEVMYTSLERHGAFAEVGHRLSLEPVWPSGIRHEIHRLDVRAERVLDVGNLDTLKGLGVNAAAYGSLDYTSTQAAAAAANFLEYHGLIVPSARYNGLNFVLFSERSDQGASVTITTTEAVDWTSWRKARRPTSGPREA